MMAKGKPNKDIFSLGSALDDEDAADDGLMMLMCCFTEPAAARMMLIKVLLRMTMKSVAAAGSFV